MARKTLAQRRKQETRSTPEEDPEFQIAPMIDVLLVLLVFFMSISSTEVLQNVPDISLPIAQDARDAGDNPTQQVVNIRWNPMNDTGVVIVNEQPYDNPDALIPMLNAAIMRNPMTRVLVRADKETRYEYTRELLRAVGDAGVENITFSVYDRETPSPEATP